MTGHKPSSHKKRKIRRLDNTIGMPAYSAWKKSQKPIVDNGANAVAVQVTQSQTLDYFWTSPPTFSPHVSPVSRTVAASPLVDDAAINKKG